MGEAVEQAAAAEPGPASTGGEECVLRTGPLVEDSMVLVSCEDISVREAEEEDGKHLVYEPQNEGVFLMNATAKQIFDLCDGQRSVADIVEMIRQDFEVPEGVDVRQAVVGYLEVLLARKFLMLK